MTEVQSASATVADGRPVSEAVIQTVAEATGRDPTDLDQLFDVLDPDALDDLFGEWTAEDPHSDPSVVFSYAGCRVSVNGDRVVATPEEEV